MNVDVETVETSENVADNHQVTFLNSFVRH